MRNGGLRKLEENLRRDEVELVTPDTEYVVYKARWLVLLSIVTVRSHSSNIKRRRIPYSTENNSEFDREYRI